ncbi:hypothetical protein [Acidovorax sp. FG27]|uniref:hypothetical protein n=1 Tax=Acidovorax sp. FG27 TaxID=3133652 RepID=UPI0030E7AF40
MTLVLAPTALRLLAAGLLLAIGMLPSPPVRAHEGHDDAPAPAARAGQPRFTAASELFELVGVLDGRQLALYLDHAPTNAPVKDATLELEIGERKLQALPQGDGRFEATLEPPLPEGTWPVTATVAAGNDSDLLAGEWDIHGDAHAEPAHARGWREHALWGAGGIAALALAVAALRMARGKADAA